MSQDSGCPIYYSDHNLESMNQQQQAQHTNPRTQNPAYTSSNSNQHAQQTLPPGGGGGGGQTVPGAGMPQVTYQSPSPQHNSQQPPNASQQYQQSNAQYSALERKFRMNNNSDEISVKKPEQV